MSTIGLIGHGVVGQAEEHGFAPYFDICIYDKHKTPRVGSSGRVCESIHEVVQLSTGPIFICVPTPMNQDWWQHGACDTFILESVIEEIDEMSKLVYEKPVVAIKSTVPPGTTKRLSEKYPNLNIGFNPEFLTERNAIEDFKNQDRVIIGGDLAFIYALRHCHQVAFHKVPIYECDSTEAEMVKYVTNVHLAVKVSLANEFSEICDKLDISYDKVVELATKDLRLGKSHWSVPGPDGHLGFGGTCFPKDINALIHVAKQIGIDPIVMSAAWNKNITIRKEP